MLFYRLFYFFMMVFLSTGFANTFKRRLALCKLVLILLCVTGTGVWAHQPSDTSNSNSQTMVTSTPLTANQVLALALVQNLQLQQATDQTLVAKSRYWLQWAALLPSVTVRTEKRTFNLPFIPTENQSLTPTAEVSMTVPLNQPLWIKEAHYWWNAAQFDRDDALQGVLANVANAYYDALQARLDLANAEQAITEAQQQLTLAAQTGDKAEDTTRAQSQLVQQQRRVTGAQNQQAQTLQALRLILNLPPEAPLVLALTDAAPLPLVPAPVTEATLLTLLRTQHPQLVRLQAECQALTYQLKQDQTRWLPTVTGRAYWGSTGQTLQTQSFTRDAGVAVQLNLLERMGTTIPLRVTEKAAVVRQKQAEQLNAQRQLETNLIQSRLDSQALLDNLEQVRQEKTLATQNYQQALKRYQAQELPFVAVTDAQDSLINARSNYVQTVFNYNRAQVRQLRAVGRINPAALLAQQPWP
jgi:outer membrane protein TolC